MFQIISRGVNPNPRRPASNACRRDWRRKNRRKQVMYSRKYDSKPHARGRMAGHISLALSGALAINAALSYVMENSFVTGRAASAPVVVADIGELPVVHVQAPRKTTQVACAEHFGKV